MSCTYLILAHKNPAQVERLIRRLLEAGSRIVLHMDLKADPPDTLLEKFDRSQVVGVKRRFHAAWGSWELVLAALALLEDGLTHFPESSRFTLLSGQDYPIKNPGHIDTFLRQSDSDIIRCAPLRNEKWKYGNVRRIDRFYWAKNRKSLAGFFFRTIPCPPRMFPMRLDDVYVGSQWWSFRNETATKVLKAVRENWKTLTAFRWTYIPDELFFQTVLATFVRPATAAIQQPLHYVERFSLPRDYLRLKIINRNGLKILRDASFERIQSAPELFARKFDMTVDSGILDRLDTL